MITARRGLGGGSNRPGGYADGTVEFGRASEAFQVRVSPSSADRALRLLCSLFAALGSHALLATKTDREERMNFASSFGTPLEFRIHERRQQQDFDLKRDVKPEHALWKPRFIWTPTGQFDVELRTRGRFPRSKWSDGNYVRVDERLREVLRDAVILAASERSSREARRVRETTESEVRQDAERRAHEREADARRVDASM
jgi:hypothetical protein